MPGKKTERMGGADAQMVAAEEPETVPEQAPEEPASETVLGPFTVLSTMIRNGAELMPGAAVTFLVHEVQHVRDLLERRVLHPGTGADAQMAVEAAEQERQAARNTPFGV
jgi:hypothetical protein